MRSRTTATHTPCVAYFLPTSDDRIVLNKLAEEVASFKCALSIEQPVLLLFLVICVEDAAAVFLDDLCATNLCGRVS